MQISALRQIYFMDSMLKQCCTMKHGIPLRYVKLLIISLINALNVLTGRILRFSVIIVQQDNSSILLLSNANVVLDTGKFCLKK